MDSTFHYPPELLDQLVDTIPRLGKSKGAVILFFKGSGAPLDTYSDLERQLKVDPDSLSMFQIARTILTRLNERGDATLRTRREVLKRVTEFEDFSRCYPDNAMKAKGLVSLVRETVNAKDTLTRLQQAHEKEQAKHTAAKAKEAERLRAHGEEFESIKTEFFSLFTLDSEPQRRGKLLERVMNRYFKHEGILVHEDFKLVSDGTGQLLEQVDGVVKLDSRLCLVEMKWLKQAVGPDDVSRHMMRMIPRSSVSAVFISNTTFSEAALKICRDSLQHAPIALATVEELVELLNERASLPKMLTFKLDAAVITREPFVPRMK